MILIIVSGVIFGLAMLYNYFTRDYTNPYTLSFIFGKKGSGKSTMINKLAYEYRKKGWNVYSTEETPGSYLISPSDIGIFDFKKHSLVLIDEVGTLWDNRNYRDFRPEVRDFFKFQRKRKLRVILFSQAYDIDKKIRDLTDDLFILKKFARVFSVARRISKDFTITDARGDDPSGVAEQYVFDPFFFPGARIITYIPHWITFFDTAKCPDLLPKNYIYIEECDKNTIFNKRIKPHIKRYYDRAEARIKPHYDRALVCIKSLFDSVLSRFKL